MKNFTGVKFWRVPALALLSANVFAQTVTTTGGTSGLVPVFSGASSIVNSNLYYSNGFLGIGKSPTVALDLSGNALIGGQLVIGQAGTATSSLSYSSHSFKFQTSAYNSSSKVAVSPFLQFVA